jgi:hypothetical protein
LTISSSLGQAIVAHHSGLVSDEALQYAVTEVAPLVNDKDLVLATLSLNLCCTLLQIRPNSAVSIATAMLGPTVELAKSPVIQVSART